MLITLLIPISLGRDSQLLLQELNLKIVYLKGIASMSFDENHQLYIALSG